MEFPEARIMVFAKAPIPGQTKTRLIPALGAEGAAELHERLVNHTLNTAIQANLCPVQLWCAAPPEHPFFSALLQRHPITLKQQQGADLGERMGNAFIDALTQSPYALLIGSDTPSLSHQDLHDALMALKNGCECVLNPAEDGGYVLIGLRRIDMAIFRNIIWGSHTVLEETRQRLQQQGMQWCELKTHRDIDRPEDLLLCHLPESLSRAVK